MARRKNLERRRIILSNTFHLIRENGMDNVSFQMIAEKSGISKSLLQSYYSHKSKLIDDVVRNLLNTLDQQVEKFNQTDDSDICARTKAFIYTIAKLGVYDRGLDRIISEVFMSNETLDNWSRMLNGWIENNRLFAEDNYDLDDVQTGIAFVVTGVGRLYHDRDLRGLSAEQMADYATSSLMFSFLHCSPKQIETALDDGHRIIASIDIKKIHHAIDTMFAEGKEIVC
ncbi:TetR/AcrR family transcriptional regulator [Lactobacillus sp. ESL0703]|uniref:TetR/AcrR family transcriptional regulator n=1 Tax=Lactobacillus sp. ESL0703 TaxID=2983218 RepID=UPI0023F701E9|nr:TetR/AcrR family transcriptional regulator [Lactobacillus sp. ESL0703]MDF7669215.1 TetR/AcrR family transcriptional regulator [Lactobacillus sp. ESL0703]